MAAACTDLDLLLIGKTGSGKSRTGNSILQRNAFVAHAGSASVTTEVNYDVSDYRGRIIKVVDGPGVGDTRLDDQAAVQLVIKSINDAIIINPRGYHAFLLVVRFGGRFTQEDVDTVKFLKSVFGEDFVRKFCILVMTCGDCFQHESEETGETFPQWCQNQSGVFKQLLEECDGRIVLFNNVTKVEAVKDAQLDTLIQMVSGLASQGERYSDANFESAKVERQKVIVESNQPVVREEAIQECSLILQNLERIRNEEDHQKQLNSLQALLERATLLVESIQEQDQGTEALQDIQGNVHTIVRAITEAINVHKKMETEMENFKLQERELKARMDRQLQEQREQFEKQMDDEKRSWEERREMEKQLDKQRQEMEEESRERSESQVEELQRQLREERERLNEQIAAMERERQRIKKKSSGGLLALISSVWNGVQFVLRWYF